MQYKGAPPGFPGGPGVEEASRPDRAETRSGGEHYSAICSACGGPARLTFKPSPDRPVFCRTCYQARSGMGGNR
jgi:CxxC-x17-CxxC domain-containing protein